MTTPVAREGVTLSFLPRPAIALGWLLLGCGLSVAAAGIAWLCSWFAIVSAREDLVEGMPVVAAWICAAYAAAASFTGPVVCLCFCRRVRSGPSRAWAFVVCAVALVIGAGTAVFVFALPFQ